MAQLDEDAAAEAVIDAAFAHGGVDDDAAGDGG
jgi:hypothetical protein